MKCFDGRLGFLGLMIIPFLLLPKPGWTLGKDKPSLIQTLSSAPAAIMPNAATLSDFTTRLEVKKIKPSRKNRQARGEANVYPKTVRCQEFSGTHAGNTVYFQAQAHGGSGKYKHTLIYSFSGFSQGNDPSGKQIKSRASRSGKFKVTLPDLRDEISHIQFTVLLITEDRNNPNLVAENEMIFTVSRPIILSKSTSAQALEKECFERYVPHESLMGLITNYTSQPMTMEIQHQIEKSSAITRGWIAGIYFSPVSFVGFGNPIFGNLGYFKQTNRQMVEKVNATLRFQILPGENKKLFIQPSRYIKAYDATWVDYCGVKQKAEGAYYFQTWGFSHLLHPVSPDHPSVPTQIGAPPMNTCPQELSSLPEGGPPTDFDFVIL